MEIFATISESHFQDESQSIPTAILDELPLLASYVDQNLVYRFVNKAYERWYGVGRAEMIGRSVGVLNPESAAGLAPLFERVLTGETVRIEHTTRFPKGRRTLEATFTPRRSASGEVLGFFTFCEDVTDRRAAATAVENALDGLADGFLRLDADWRIITFNSAAERFWGRPRGAVLGRRIHELWPDAVDSPSAALVERVLESRVPERAELQSHAAPGKSFLIDVVPLGDGGVGVVIEDTTERRTIERALAESEARFRGLVQALPGLVFLCDAGGSNRYVNAAFCRYAGRNEPELVGMRWTEIVHPDDLESTAACWETAAEDSTGQGVELRLRRADGAWRWHLVSTAPERDETGRLLGWAGAAIDIHDRKAAEEALQVKRDLLQAVVDTSPDPIFVKNLDGTFRVANQATSRAIGAEGRDITGSRDRDWIDAAMADRIEAADARVFAGETIVLEEAVEDLGPASRTFLSTKTPLRTAEGEIVGLVGIARDISERKEGERHRDLLIGELNHRVKNTLAVVQSIAAQTLKVEADPRVALKAFEARLTSLARAHDILVEHRWDPAPFRDLLDRALAPFRTGLQRFVLDGPDVRLEPRVAVALALVLHELATNAVKYGALSNGTGVVMIAWRTSRGDCGPVMRLSWRERGGPPVVAPTRRGFGSRLVERALAGELKGGAKLDFRPEGVVCDLVVALPT